MSKSARTRYRTLNWSAYNAALRERGSLTVWFDPGMVWHAVPSGKRGGQPVYSDAAIQSCLTIKVLFGLPFRQTTGFVASLLKLAAPAGACGARSTSPWTRAHSRSAPWRSLAAAWAMPPCCPTCSVRSPRTRRSPPSPQMAPDGHPRLPRRHRETRCGRDHTASAQRQAVEEGHFWRGSPERSPARDQAIGPDDLALVER